MLPQWMKMRKDETSVGAQFLNVFGLEFDDVKRYMDFCYNNMFIGKADTKQIDVIYKVPMALSVIADIEKIETIELSVNGELELVTVTPSLREFYLYQNEFYAMAILDREEGYIYINPSEKHEQEGKVKYEFIIVNGKKHYDFILHHVWNCFDEFGLLLGVDRLHGEKNAAFKERILDVFRKPANSTKNGLQNAISRSLGIQKEMVSINEFSDYAYRNSLLERDGSPSDKFLRYVDQINKTLGFSWGNMAWGEAYWRSVEESKIGFEYLPHVWDASMENWKEQHIQSGIGDGDDLLVHPPKEESNIRKAKAYVGVRGREVEDVTLYPEIDFKYKITANGLIPTKNYTPEKYKYTIHSSEIIKLHYIVRSFKSYIQMLRVDFNRTTPGYTFDNESDPSVEMITGNTIMTNHTDPILKAVVEMATTTNPITNIRTDTPSLQELSIKWIATDGSTHDYVMTTQDDFTQTNEKVYTTMKDMYVTPEGNVELGFGDFYYNIDTQGSFMAGAVLSKTIEITQNGTLQLSIPKE